MTAVSDFNYKVALAEGLRHLQKGKLRQAEQQFRYLVQKFPHADGGYRGLARVQVETQDRAGALATLRDGAAVMSRGGERRGAIELLREAVGLDPLDLAAHRRLAAALALAGDKDAAAAEYVRFARVQAEAGDTDRARLEASYALETLGTIPAIIELASGLGVERRMPAREPQLGPVTPAEPPAPEPRAEEAPPPPSGEDASSVAASRASALLQAAVDLQRDSPVDVVALEERARSLIATKDRFAGPVAIQAAGALLASGKVNAASDLLLELVASGIAVHEAQKALVDVARAMGRGDVAEERARLLEEARRLG